MLSFLIFLLVALLAVIFLVVVIGLFLLSRGIDMVRSLFGLKPKSRFRWHVHTRSGDAQQQQTTTRTSDGVTIIDRRSPEETQKKIFAPDEGEYVEFTEE